MGNNPPNAKQGLQRNKGPAPPSKAGLSSKTSDTKEVMSRMESGLQNTAEAYQIGAKELLRRFKSKDPDHSIKKIRTSTLIDYLTKTERQVSGALQSMAVMKGQGLSIGRQTNILIVQRDGRDPKKIQENFPIVQIGDSGGETIDIGGGPSPMETD